MPICAASARTTRRLTAANVPADAVTSSGSGVDPEISVANADIQAHRVAALDSLPPDAVMRLSGSAHGASGRGGLFGGEGINVLTVNLALDKLGTAPEARR